MTVMGVGVAVIEVCAHTGRMWLATPIFLLLAGAAVFAWMRVLGHSDSLANRNRDELIAKLAKTE